MKEYIPAVPHQYVYNASKMQARPPKMGTIGNEPRFKQHKVKATPGVGDYDLTNFKNFAKASETQFEMPKYSRIHGGKLDRRNRARSAVSRTIDQTQNQHQETKQTNQTNIFATREFRPLSTSRSRSPASMMGIQIGKRLGGPA